VALSSAEEIPLGTEGGSAPEPIDFFGMTESALAEALAARFGLPRYRASQLYRWAHKRGETSWDKMTDISQDLRTTLAQVIQFSSLQIADRQISVDGTRKYLFQLKEGHRIESVMIKQPNRMTLCVSSQVGCGMACQFCRTGTMGFVRHLTASEIVQQVRGVLADARNFGDSFSNLVFMGMGEPLHNFDGVTTAIRILTTPSGLGLGARKITVSTVGLVPAIRKLADLNLPVQLAVSLNATSDDVRSDIMPINRRFPLEVLIDTLRYYAQKTEREVTLEYVMLSGVTDTEADLKRLPRIANAFPSKVNLIPYNDNAGLGFASPTKEYVHYWRDTLQQKGINARVRWSKGPDISAACGQLATNSRRPARADPANLVAIGL